MNPQGEFVAALLENAGKGYATGAIMRLQDRIGADEVEALGFARLVADTEKRIATLGEALAAGRHELFRLDLEWVAGTLAARNLPLEPLSVRLECLRAELAEQLPPDAAAAATEIMDAACADFEAAHCEPVDCLVDDSPHVDLARKFLLAVLEGQRAIAEKLVLDAFDGGASISELHHRVILRVQSELGRLWQSGKANVAEEHLGSRIVEDVLVILRSRADRKPENGLCVLTASIPGNLHDIGARLVADQFEMAGWRSLFLGADTPAPDLVAAVTDFKADLVALSAGQGLHIRALARLVAAIRKEQPKVPVIVGGPPFFAIADLWKDVGANGSSPDAISAVAVGEQLVRKARKDA